MKKINYSLLVPFICFGILLSSCSINKQKDIENPVQPEQPEQQEQQEEQKTDDTENDTENTTGNVAQTNTQTGDAQTGDTQTDEKVSLSDEEIKNIEKKLSDKNKVWSANELIEVLFTPIKDMEAVPENLKKVANGKRVKLKSNYVIYDDYGFTNFGEGKFVTDFLPKNKKEAKDFFEGKIPLISPLNSIDISEDPLMKTQKSLSYVVALNPKLKYFTDLSFFQKNLFVPVEFTGEIKFVDGDQPKPKKAIELAESDTPEKDYDYPYGIYSIGNIQDIKADKKNQVDMDAFLGNNGTEHQKFEWTKKYKEKHKKK